jgi:hypothetical protein
MLSLGTLGNIPTASMPAAVRPYCIFALQRYGIAKKKKSTSGFPPPPCSQKVTCVQNTNLIYSETAQAMLVVTGQDGECQGAHDRREEGGGGSAAVRHEVSHTSGWCCQHEHRQLHVHIA